MQFLGTSFLFLGRLLLVGLRIRGLYVIDCLGIDSLCMVITLFSSEFISEMVFSVDFRPKQYRNS